MRRFAALIETLDHTNKTNQKVAALTDYFINAPKEDALWAVALLSHRRPSRPVTTTLMRAWAADQAHLPEWLFEESYHIVGDLAETIALLIPQDTRETPPSLSQCIKEIIELKAMQEDQKKELKEDPREDLLNGEQLLVLQEMLVGNRHGEQDEDRL